MTDKDTKSFIGSVDRLVEGQVSFAVMSSEDGVTPSDQPCAYQEKLPDASIGDWYDCEMDPETAEVVEAEFLPDKTVEQKAENIRTMADAFDGNTVDDNPYLTKDKPD